eukprot:scaffold37558_cov48-Phaeocystis_antarctica.AAC.2
MPNMRKSDVTAPSPRDRGGGKGMCPYPASEAPPLTAHGLPQQRVWQRSLWPEIVTSARPKRQAGAPKPRPAWVKFWSI